MQQSLGTSGVRLFVTQITSSGDKKCFFFLLVLIVVVTFLLTEKCIRYMKKEESKADR